MKLGDKSIQGWFSDVLFLEEKNALFVAKNWKGAELFDLELSKLEENIG